MMAKPPQVVGDVELLGAVWLRVAGGIQNCWGLQRACGCSTARGCTWMRGAVLLERCRKVGPQHYWGEAPPCSGPLMRHLLNFLLLLLANREAGRGRTGLERKRGHQVLTLTRLGAGLSGTGYTAVRLCGIK